MLSLFTLFGQFNPYFSIILQLKIYFFVIFLFLPKEISNLNISFSLANHNLLSLLSLPLALIFALLSLFLHSRCHSSSTTFMPLSSLPLVLIYVIFSLFFVWLKIVLSWFGFFSCARNRSICWWISILFLLPFIHFVTLARNVAFVTVYTLCFLN